MNVVIVFEIWFVGYDILCGLGYIPLRESIWVYGCR